MKKLFILIVFQLTGVLLFAQAGKYAGTKKAMLGKVYTETQELPQLKGWKQLEGGVINKLDEPEMILVNVFQKGTTVLVFFSIKEDTASDKYLISDVLEVTGVQKGWEIRSSFCRQNKVENSFIVVWGKTTTNEFMNVLKKAWIFNRDKRRIEIIPIKGIDCENIGC
ncbi:hypothetical protein CAP36_04880 [Chitinophagaceae bacterium IBVUCB2]|nr:hypothetical protein CAP36_04880 [Chitinophagaceae bacterium IBVUCB2]